MLILCLPVVSLVDKLHLTFVKVVLGVPTRTTNWVIRSETGRYPLALRAWESMVKYWHHLNNTDSNLLKSALLTNKRLASEGFPSWYAYLDRLLRNTNLGHLPILADNIELALQINKVKDKLQRFFVSSWDMEKLKAQNEGKLELFASLKDSFGYSKYLSEVKNPNHRIALTRMRASAHSFPIESGRYNSTPRCDRECSLGCGVLGDEYHYMNACSHPFINELIVGAREKISILDNNFIHLGVAEKLNFMLNNKDTRILLIMGKFCYKLQEQFKELTL